MSTCVLRIINLGVFCAAAHLGRGTLLACVQVALHRCRDGHGREIVTVNHKERGKRPVFGTVDFHVSRATDPGAEIRFPAGRSSNLQHISVVFLVGVMRLNLLHARDHPCPDDPLQRGVAPSGRDLPVGSDVSRRMYPCSWFLQGHSGLPLL